MARYEDRPSHRSPAPSSVAAPSFWPTAPTVNSVGAEIGKPIAPQTASVGVSTTRFVRNEGEVIRHNFFWCLVVLVYLVIIGVGFYLFGPGAMAV